MSYAVYSFELLPQNRLPSHLCPLLRPLKNSTLYNCVSFTINLFLNIASLETRTKRNKCISSGGIHFILELIVLLLLRGGSLIFSSIFVAPLRHKI